MKYIAPLAFGLAGGLIAVAGTGLLGGGKEEPVMEHAVIGPGTVRPVVHDVAADSRTGAAGSVDLREAARKTVPAVVNVNPVQMGRVYYGNPLDFWFGVRRGQIREEPIDVGVGSGVIITEDGYIITNNHVVEGADALRVTIDGQEYEAEVVGTDPSSDLASKNVVAGDIITYINDKQVTSYDVLANELAEFKPGDTVKLTIYRSSSSGGAGRSFEVNVVLIESAGE